MRTLRIAAAAAIAATAVGCSASVVSEGGYQGTWSRSGPTVRSTVSIVVDGDEAWFRWSQRSDDGAWTVRCDWHGRCEEHLRGEKISEYRFRAWIDPETGRMRVEARRTLLKQPHEVHWIDDLRLEDGGRTLVAVTLERDGWTYETGGPVYLFRKVADAVADPPRGLSGGTGSAFAAP